MGHTPNDRDDDAMMSALRRLMEEGRPPSDSAQVRPGLTLLTPRHYYRPTDPVPIHPTPPVRPAPPPSEAPPSQEPLVLGPTDRAPEPLVLGPALAVPPEPVPPEPAPLAEDDRPRPLLLRPAPPLEEHAPQDEEPTGPVGEIAGPEEYPAARPPAEPAPPPPWAVAEDAPAQGGDPPAAPPPSGSGGADGPADSFEFPRDMAGSLPPGSVDPILYDATLRALVADVLREELQGDLGERITANLRKLIRREVLRALAARDRP